MSSNKHATVYRRNNNTGQAASEFGKYFDKIIDMLCLIETKLPRFRVYEKLFDKHARVLHSLSLVYLDILEFCMQARSVFRTRDEGGRTGSRRFFSFGSQQGVKALWKPFEQRFGHLVTRIELHSSSADRDADISHMIDASEGRELDKNSWNALERRVDGSHILNVSGFR